MKQAILIVCVVVGMGSAAIADTTLFSDGDFGGWSFGSAAATGSSASVVLSGNGNPGAGLEVTTITGPVAYGTAFSDIVWDPGTQGAISNLDMSLDVKSISGWGQGQNLLAAVLQNGNTYARAISAVTGSQVSWHTITRTGVTQASMGLSSPDGVIWDTSQNPDFSETGAPLRFGFVAGNGSSGTYTQLYDNWSMSITHTEPVPVPGAAMLGIIGIGMVGAYTRRYRQANITAA